MSFNRRKSRALLKFAVQDPFRRRFQQSPPTMATCEELTAQRSTLLAAITADDAVIQAAQLIKASHQMQLWYVEYNLFLQGCIPGGGEGSGSGSGSGSGYGMSAAVERKFPAFPVRSPAEMVFIRSCPELSALHDQAEARARMVGLVA